MDRSVDLTEAEWQSLSQLTSKTLGDAIPLEHKHKLIRLGVAAEKHGRTVVTFEGKLALRAHH
jgi:hypothetical protein